MTSPVTGAVIVGSDVHLTPPDDTAIPIPGRWLRDHGDDPQSLDPDSGQRLVDTFAIAPDVAPTGLTLDDGVLMIEWSDGSTTTNDIESLMAVVGRRRHPRPGTGLALAFDPGVSLWPTGSEPALVDGAAIDDDDLWAEALGALRRNGWVMFEGVEAGKGVLERLAGRIGYPRSTIFGGIWTLEPGTQDHPDSAYDTTGLDVHTDGTYSHDAPGLIIFSQQERDGTGGDSVLVDGFAAARDLAATDSDAADLLTRFDIRANYLEPGVHLVAERPVLRTDADGVLRQISFNNYDRAPLLPAADWVDPVIDAYAAFRALVADSSRALRLPWSPGRVLILDNWRLLHGRTSYTGSRRFHGMYTNHEDLESAWRLAGLA